MFVRIVKTKVDIFTQLTFTHSCIYVTKRNMFTQEIALKGVMSRKTKLPDEEVAWLKQFHNTYSHKELAERYDVCIDTLKRILMRLNLQYFPGAKYQIKPSPKKWKRPCMSCGCTKPRPKNQYRCDPCLDKEADARRIAYEEEHKTQARKKPYTPDVFFLPPIREK